MALIPGHNQRDIDDGLDDDINQIIAQEVRIMQYVGEEFVNNCRDIRTYNDITGNLRSSIGYVVAVDAKIQQSAITGGEGSPKGVQAEGKNKGESLATKLATDKNSTVLIGVAGMEYASSVEARNKDVITNSSIIARKTLEGLLREL
jgi:hypothetical protein